MNTFSYDRVSSDEQRKEGINLKIKKDKFLKEGVTPDNIFTDAGISGGFNETSEVKIKVTEEEFIVSFPIKKRPGFNKLIQKLNTTPNSKLIFSKYDRISRSSSFGDLFFIWLQQKGIEWKALEDIDTHQSPAMRRFLLAWANDRRDNDASNIDSQRENLYAEGIYPFRANFGYIKNIKEESTGKLRYPELREGALIIDQEKAKIVKECFRVAIKSQETHNNKLYLEVCAKHKIDPSTYYAIIKNPIYTGKTGYKGEWKNSPYVPAIITEEEYKKANKKIRTQAPH